MRLLETAVPFEAFSLYYLNNTPLYDNSDKAWCLVPRSNVAKPAVAYFAKIIKQEADFFFRNVQ